MSNVMRSARRSTAAAAHLRALTTCQRVALAGVVALAVAVVVRSPVVHLDLEVVRAVHVRAFEAATMLMQSLSELAATDTLMWMTALVAFVLLVVRHWHGALALVVSVAATQALVAVVKVVVDRPRPPASDALVEAAGHSFPSAHTASGAAFYGLLAIVALHEPPGRARWLLIGLAVSLTIGVGLSRVYLGAHYPTDVAAGWLLGWAIALGSWRAAVTARRLASASA